MPNFRKRAERKRIREAIKMLSDEFNNPRFIVLICEVQAGPDFRLSVEALENILVEEQTPETLLLEREAYDLSRKVEEEVIRRKVLLHAQKIIMADKSPETYIKECEMMGFRCSQKAENDQALKLVEALCFVNLIKLDGQEDVQSAEASGVIFQ